MIRKVYRYLYRLYKKIKKIPRNFHIWSDYLKTKRHVQGIVSESIASGENVLIVSFSNIPFLLKVHSLLGQIVRKRNYNPILLTSSGCNWASPYGKIFGVNSILYWDEIEKIALNESFALKFLRYKEETFDSQFFKTLEYKNVAIGKLALSTFIRKKTSATFDLNSDEIKEQIFKIIFDAIDDINKAEWLIEKYKPAKLFVRDSGYLPNGAIYEMALSKGVDCIRFESSQMQGEWQVKRYKVNNKGQALWSCSESTWAGIKETPLTNEQNNELDLDFRERYQPGSEKDLYQYQKGKRMFDKDEIYNILQLDKSKKTAVVFSHISWDANFFDGEDLFDNFEHWLVETVRIAINNPNVNWIIKLHPANVYKLSRENKGKGIARETEMDALATLGDLPSHIKIVRASTEVNTWSLIQIIDFGLTVRGTIGAELPCFGIPVVTAGTGRYNNFGFTIDPTSREEYQKCLMNIQGVPKLDKATIELARRHAYYFFLRRTVNFNEISHMTSSVHDKPNNPFHHNLNFKRNPIFQSNGKMAQFENWLFDTDQEDFIPLDIR